MTRGRRVLFQLAVLVLGVCPGVAYGAAIAVDSGGRVAIHGELPAGWRQMTAEELRIFEKNGRIFLLRQGNLVTGYLADAGNALADGPLILVFEAGSEKQMQQEEIQKIYSWFERQRELVTEALPAAVEHMTIENIEYAPDRTAILFQSAIEMDNKDFICISSIIFMRDGYIVLIGLAKEDAGGHREDIAAFMRNIRVPESRRLKQEYEQEDTVTRWLLLNWQRALGFALLLSVFAVALGRKS